MKTKQTLLVMGLLALASGSALADEVQPGCAGGGVLVVLSCTSEIMQGGNGVRICNKMNKDLYADVTGVIAQGGRRGVIASFKIKQKRPTGVGGSTLYVDTKTGGKDFALAYHQDGTPVNGGHVAELDLNGRKSPELICVRTR